MTDFAPTLADAQETANLISATYDVQSILLYGSVHLGTSHDTSDIDMYVIFDDLEDYSVRGDWAVALLETTSTADAPIDLAIRDVPEWLAYSRLESSFERYVRDNSRELFARAPREADHSKKQFPQSDQDLACQTLAECGAAIRELTLWLSQDTENALTKHQFVCRSSDSVIVRSIQAIGQAKSLPYPPKAAELQDLMKYVSQADANLCGRLEHALGPAVPEQAHYLAPVAETRPEAARPLPETVQHAAGDMAAAAVNTFYAACEAVGGLTDGAILPARFRQDINTFVDQASSDGMRWVVDIAEF